MKNRAKITLLVATMVLVVLPGRAWAAPSDIDTSFGTDGIASQFAGCGGSCTFPNDVAILADGRLVEVGVSNTESEQFFGIGAAAEVFGADGTWESSSFGTARLLLNAYRAIAPDPGGGAVMAGYAQRCTTATDPCENLSPGFFMISKALADGSPDPTFDDDGVVITWMAQGGGFANGVALQPDGKIVAVGPVTDGVGNPLIAAVRYLPSGTRDPSFGTDGRVLLPGGTANDVEVSDDGTIVIAGNAAPTGFLVVRLLNDGTPDPGFGDGDGIVVEMSGRNAGANDLALAPGRKIVVGGMVEKTDPVLGTVRGFGVMRLTWSGEPDPRFNEDGQIVTFDEGGWAWVDELVVTSEREIIGGGGFGVVRYTKRGIRDTTFGGDGRAEYPWVIEGSVLQGNKLVMGINSGDYGMSLTRILL